MDLQFTTSQRELKRQIEEFCQEEIAKAPPGWVTCELDEYCDDAWNYHASVVMRAAEKGYLCQGWPVEYGGKGHGPIEQLIFGEVTGYYNVPAIPKHYPQIAHVLMRHGTEQQKQRWLPLLAQGKVRWAELYSEPEAGSDLASLRTSAVRDGDDWVMNGHKIWTSAAQRADHGFGLVRTDPEQPRHRGLTFFVGELGPGIQFRPLLSMNRAHRLNETLIENFRLRTENIVGEVNRGWYVMQAGRTAARANIQLIASTKRDIELLAEFCNETVVDGVTLAKNPIHRQRLADLSISSESSRLYAYYLGWRQSQGIDVSAEAAACGYYCNEVARRVAETAVEIMGLYGPLKSGCKWAPLFGKFQNMVQLVTHFCIAGGTTEIRKNVIAALALSLPRD